MTQINFVRHRRKELTKLEIQDARNFRWGLYGFGAVIGILILAMTVRLLLVNQIARTTESVASINQSIKNKQAVEDEYLLMMKKIQIITDLFGQRREKQEALAYFSSLFDPEIIVSQLKYDADTNTLSFTIRAPSIFSMKKVFDTMRSSNVKEKYPTFSIGGLARGMDASYSMSVNLPLPTRPIATTDQGATILVTPDEGGQVGTTQPMSPVTATPTP